jgi:hypothetical protein
LPDRFHVLGGRCGETRGVDCTTRNNHRGCALTVRANRRVFGTRTISHGSNGLVCVCIFNGFQCSATSPTEAQETRNGRRPMTLTVDEGVGRHAALQNLVTEITQRSTLVRSTTTLSHAGSRLNHFRAPSQRMCFGRPRTCRAPKRLPLLCYN